MVPAIPLESLFKSKAWLSCVLMLCQVPAASTLLEGTVEYLRALYVLGILRLSDLFVSI